MNRLLLVLLFSLTLIACSPTIVGPTTNNEPVVLSEADPHLVRADTARVQSPDVPGETAAALLDGHNRLALDLYKTAAAGHEENIFFSPYSIHLAFSMLYAGARQETEAQMAGVLHFLPQTEHHAASNALEQQVASVGNNLEFADESTEWLQLNIANAVWGQEGFPFSETYLDTLAQQYDTGLRLLDFANPEKARLLINDWVAQQTEGKIETIFPPDTLQPETRLVLTNAIYFNASWQFPFAPEQTEMGVFTRLDGHQLTVPMMRKEAVTLLYLADDGYQVVRLPYTGYAAELLIILPNEGQFDQIEGQLTSDFITNMRRRAARHEVNLTLPRFALESDLDLGQVLTAMGLDRPFSSTTADFSGIAAGGGLFVSDALHRAVITVDEVGTEAAAATGISMVVSESPPATMTIDRPFILAIVTNNPQTILFLGRVMDIE
ncbi:MAG: serpin family protein [Chloroflexota bacterium]